LEGIPVKIIEGDIATDDGIQQDDFNSVQTVFHLAALPKRANASQTAYQNVNIDGTRRILACAQKAGVTRFVYCSTASVHAEGNKTNPITENTPFQTDYWYTKTKLEAEQLALQWGQENHIPVTVIRPAVICGPWNKDLLRLFHAIQRKRFVMIGDGNNSCHVVHAEDLAKAFIQASKAPDAINKAFIIAGPSAMSLHQFMDAICDTLGVRKPQLHIPVEPALFFTRTWNKICELLHVSSPITTQSLDIFTKNRAFDSSKAKAILGYEPEITPTEAISRAIVSCRQCNLL
jgi:nucleoside-diphosphate-sugar epimerase